MSIIDRVRDIIAPLLAPLELELYDVEHNGGQLRVTVDSVDGATLDEIAEATRAISRALDDTDPLPGSYTLEVSSPGVERKLRTPEHFAGAVGEQVKLKLAPYIETARRLEGTLQSADDLAVVICDGEGAEHTVALADITRANAVFVWEKAPQPGSPEARARARSGAPSDKKSETPNPERRAAAR